MLYYCRCAGKSGDDLVKCCGNDNSQFQKDPNKKASDGKSFFFKENLSNYIRHSSPSKRDSGPQEDGSLNGTEIVSNSKRAEPFLA